MVTSSRDDHLHAAAALTGQAPALDRGLDALVVGDGDDVQVRVALHVLEDLHRGGGSVGRDGVDVDVGLAQLRRGAVGHAASPPFIDEFSRSGQIG